LLKFAKDLPGTRRGARRSDRMEKVRKKMASSGGAGSWEAQLRVYL
jgi:hypothetical protein